MLADLRGVRADSGGIAERVSKPKPGYVSRQTNKIGPQQWEVMPKQQFIEDKIHGGSCRVKTALTNNCDQLTKVLQRVFN